MQLLMILVALILSIQHAGGTNGSSSSSWRREHSSSLPPYRDVVGSPTTPVAGEDVPGAPAPTPYCVYPPPAKPTLPATLPPTPPPPAAERTPFVVTPGSPPPPMASNVPPPPPPPPGMTQPGVWCVANPTVASALAQTAMDYACGSGADCDMMAPGAPCFLPDTLMAHASYAFNSYWQRTKVAGGTCDFAGAAMLITKDPTLKKTRTARRRRRRGHRLKSGSGQPAPARTLWLCTSCWPLGPCRGILCWCRDKSSLILCLR
ncbi:hypothetical protein GUJ93_ZPchr0006g41715 [Zizania palustris]|uniref:X8 domain-containing protein n=1 Tax=Zizania palustris TaxID=103762 RepID=A0A8J5SZL3_ZIZPA|nr:hypothetical protein GUJ93_ZPchr0006g41715 [Zizania palustris]